MAARPLPHDSVLLIAYGGPTRASEIRPFLDNVLRGRRVPASRYEEVVGQYEAVGGSSPINDLTFRQAAALRDVLEREGPALPVYVGMRLWHPLLEETLAAMSSEGRRHAVGIILAPHPSQASREAYLEAIARARERLGPASPTVDCAPPFFERPSFIGALEARARRALEEVPEGRRREAAVIYTAHSIPVAMSESSGYSDAVARTAELVSAALGVEDWTVAYQSRSGGPRERWLEPDIGDALRALRDRGRRDAVVVPIGFICDHVEVLYDLDIRARAVAERLGLGFRRAATVGDHPAFARMLAGLVRDVAALPAT